MAISETNTASYPHDFVSGALLSLAGLGFAHADTLPEMDCISPLCASPPRSSPRRLRAHSVRGPVLLPDGFPPAPMPRFVSQPPTHPHGLPPAAGHRSAPAFMRRLAATRIRWRKSERTPNHALQRTGAAVTPAASCLRLSPTTRHVTKKKKNSHAHLTPFIRVRRSF